MDTFTDNLTLLQELGDRLLHLADSYAMALQERTEQARGVLYAGPAYLIMNEMVETICSTKGLRTRRDKRPGHWYTKVNADRLIGELTNQLNWLKDFIMKTSPIRGDDGDLASLESQFESRMIGVIPSLACKIIWAGNPTDEK